VTLSLAQAQAAVRTRADRKLYARQIEATDGEIDWLVYEFRPAGGPEREAGVGAQLRLQGRSGNGCPMENRMKIRQRERPSVYPIRRRHPLSGLVSSSPYSDADATRASVPMQAGA